MRTEFIEAAANVLAVNDMQYGPSSMLIELSGDVAEPYRQLAAKQLAAVSEVLDWEALEARLNALAAEYVVGIPVVIGAVRAWLNGEES